MTERHSDAAPEQIELALEKPELRDLPEGGDALTCPNCDEGTLRPINAPPTMWHCHVCDYSEKR